MSAEQDQSTVSPAVDALTTSDPVAPAAIEAAKGGANVIAETSEANKGVAEISASTHAPPEETKLGTDSETAEAATATALESGAEVVAPDADDMASSGKRKDSKRKSSAGIPEHKSKKLNRKKSMPSLQLDAKPGDYYWARLKGYPPWPAIICDEEMLPETLLATRPVTAMRPDGTYRPDFEEGGKNARDRTYPVMYLHTNEFSWMPNIDLTPLDFEDVKNTEQGKKSKTLWNAYLVAREEHDLQYFKNLLTEYEEALQEDQRVQAEKEAAKEAAKKERAEKKTKRKSKDAGADEDVDMEDASDGEGGKKAKASKKRKKAAESEGEGTPVKTPKTKLKVSLTKTANGDSAAKPKSKPKAAKPETPKMSEAELRAKREKDVLYLRHRLQKGFLTRDQVPKEEEMQQMSEYFKNLEMYKDLEGNIIRSTKVHKVLKAIIKLNSIPKEGEFNFKKRSADLLNLWQKALQEDVVTSPGAKEDGPNGIDKEETADSTKHAGEPQTAIAETPTAPAESTPPASTTTKVASPSATHIEVATEEADPTTAAIDADTKSEEPPTADLPKDTPAPAADTEPKIDAENPTDPSAVMTITAPDAAT